MSWFFLILAGLFEVVGVMGINQINRKRSVFAVLLIVVGFGLSLSLLSYSMQDIAMGTAYAVWTGIGTVGSALAGILFYGDSTDRRRIFCIALIVISVIGLKLIE